MQIKEIIDTRTGMANGEFRVMNIGGSWLLTDSTGVLPFSPANIETGHNHYVPTTGEVVSMALIIDYEEQDYEVHGRVEKRELSGRSLSLLPRPALPMPDMVTELDGYISGLRSRALREFLSYLFQNEQLALDFARVPASRNHHHSEEGGLLMHTVEMVRYARDGQFPIQPTNYERELLMTVSILHDIGKARMHDDEDGLPTLYRDHEEVAKEFLAEPLKWMALNYRKTAKDLVDALNDIFAKGNTYSTIVGCLLEMLDHTLSYGNASESAFNGLPPHRLVAHLNGRKGRGWTYRRFRHVHLVE